MNIKTVQDALYQDYVSSIKSVSELLLDEATQKLTDYERLCQQKDAEIAELKAERAKFERMFLAACTDLGLISEELGLGPDDGGADPIIYAIKVMRSPTSTEAGEQK